MSPAGALTTLHDFNRDTDGANPTSLIVGQNGDLFGVTMANAGSIFRISTAGAFQTLYTFASEDVGLPEGLTKGFDGNLYAAVSGGGVNNRGAILRITPEGSASVIHSFTASTDGSSPCGVLAQDSAGALYGITRSGGSRSNGTIYKVTPEGVFTVLFNFSGNPMEKTPTGSLVLGADGSIYGVTTEAGNYGTGTVYRFIPGGVLTTIYSFPGPSGAVAKLTRTNEGKIFGTRPRGGTANAGILFQVANGTLTTLYNFTGNMDGGIPGALMEGSDGRLYGSTAAGGGSLNLGTMFAITLPRIAINGLLRQSNGFTLTGIAAPNTNYSVSSTDDLAQTFVARATITTDGDGRFYYFDAVSPSVKQRFYRVSVP